MGLLGGGLRYVYFHCYFGEAFQYKGLVQPPISWGLKTISEPCFQEGGNLGSKGMVWSDAFGPRRSLDLAQFSRVSWRFKQKLPGREKSCNRNTKRALLFCHKWSYNLNKLLMSVFKMDNWVISAPYKCLWRGYVSSQEGYFLRGSKGLFIFTFLVTWENQRSYI